MWPPGVWWVTLLLDQQSISMCESAPPPSSSTGSQSEWGLSDAAPPLKKTLAAISNNTQWGCLITQLPVPSSNTLPAPPYYLANLGLAGRGQRWTTVLKQTRKQHRAWELSRNPTAYKWLSKTLVYNKAGPQPVGSTFSEDSLAISSFLSDMICILFPSALPTELWSF